MQLLERTEQYEIYLDFFENIPVRILKDIKTNEISFMAEDVSKVLGYGSLENLMGSDEVLDLMNEEHRRTGVYPISVVKLD